MRIPIVLFLVLLQVAAFGQGSFSLQDSPSLRTEMGLLPSAWTGGVNSAQIQTLDLTGDGNEEWVIWDINSRQLTVYEQTASGFIHHPEWAYFFPSDISGFLVLADFDADGKKDLFTSTALGIKVYKNTSSGNQIRWELARDFLPLDTGSNIQANNLDTPLIKDLDGDGDLDLVIFNFASGDYLEFYENTSVDRTGNPDIDGFAFPIRHWGNFEFCACADISFGQTCAGLDLSDTPSESARIQHAGGHSLLYHDWDGDALPDLLLGRDECDQLYFLPNKGTEKEPLFDAFSTALPDLGSLPQFPIFHNPSLIDGSLIISSNSNEAAPVYGVDFAQSLFTFDGSLRPILQAIQVDLGENSRPFFTGTKNGGMLWVGANGTTNGEVVGELHSFSLQNEQFDQVDPSLDIRSLNLTEVQYQEYQDQTGKQHRILTGILFEGSIPQQRIFRLESDQWVEILLEGYSANRGDHFAFFPYQNQDHMLVAGQNGGLDLYRVNFENLSAELLEQDFLEFQDNPATRNLSVAVNPETNPGLYAVDQRGVLIYIENFMEQSQREEVQIQIENQAFLTRLGRNTWISLLPDVLGDHPDLILGTRAGGLIYLKATASTPLPSEELQLILYPNPSQGPIKLISNQSGTGRILNSLGQILLEDIPIQAGQEVEIRRDFYATGLYIFQLQTVNQQQLSRKFWVR